LEREAAKVGLKINEQKTTNMIAARNDSRHEAKRGNWRQTLSSCQRICVPTNDVSMEIQRRILQIGASSDCANICGRVTFHAFHLFEATLNQFINK
jgi:hypothetical protein